MEYTSMMPRAPLIRKQVEQLEARENPSTVVFSEGFDTLAAPKLPTGWSQWSNDGEPQFITTKLTNTSTPNGLASLGSSRIAARLWNTSTYTSDFGAALNVRSDTPSRILVIVRGQNLNAATPSYIAGVVRAGGTIELLEVANGVSRSLGIVRPAVAVSNAAWLRVSVQPVGDWAGVEVQRLDTNAFLNSNGQWQSLEAEALRVRVTVKPTQGLLGIGREPGGSGSAFVDDFAVLAPPGINESFDTTRSPSIPNGWNSWASDPLPRSRVGGDKFVSGTQGLAIDGNSRTAARSWVDSGLAADTQSSVSVFADNLIPSGILVRGSALNTAAPTFYSLTAVRGLQMQIKKVVNGVETVLGTVKSTSYVSGVWIRLSLVTVGDQLRAVVYRADKNQWLAANGSWVNSSVVALAVTDGTIKTGNLVGVERGKSFSGTVWFDDFDVRSPEVQSTPGVPILPTPPSVPILPTPPSVPILPTPPSVPILPTPPSVPSALTVSILASFPLNPATKTITFTVTSAPIANITRIEFFFNGSTRAAKNAGSGSWTVDTTALINGSYVLEVRAYDNARNRGITSMTFNVQNGVPVSIPTPPPVVVVDPGQTGNPIMPIGRPDAVHHYSHIRIAMLAYAGNPAGSNEQTLAANSVDLLIPNINLLNTFETAAPETTKVIYTNVSNLYGELITDWARYAEVNGLSRDLAYYHVTQATAFSGNSPSSFPVTYFWNASLGNADGTGSFTNQTSSARGTRATAIKLGSTGQALTIGYPEEFREMNITVKTPSATGWSGVWEYASAVDASGKPTAWKTLTLLSDGTSGLKTTGQITFDPPADWVSALPASGTQRLMLVRIRTATGTTAQAPEIQTILGRDFVQANGTTVGTIPAFDTLADKDGDGYLNNAEYAQRRGGFDARFTHESRLFYPYYGQMRFLTNPASQAVQKWAGEYHTRLLALNPNADGVFIDNALGKLPFAPGTIALKESVANFTQDSATLVRAITLRLGDRWTVSNTAGSIAQADGIAAASTAVFEEFLLRPNSVNWSGFNDVVALVNRRLAADSPSPYVVLDTFSGNVPMTDERSRTGALSYYYLLADPNKTFISFFGGQQPSAAWSQSWIASATFNVGKPTAAFTTFATGIDPENSALTYKVFSRTYENALTLFKPRSYTLGKGTGTNNDATATTHALGGNYRVLNSNGTLGAVINSIVLRNGEGAVLIKA